jgi:hypothetical protein
MNDAARAELDLIRQRAGGFLRPADVVDHAKSKKSALHGFFEWDDGKAAAQYRLAQARAIIRVVVQVNEQSSEKVRAFVSLQQDRNSAGGYRAFAEVVEDEALMLSLVEQARKELACCFPAQIRSFTRDW